MRDEAYVRDPGIRLPMLEAATVVVRLRSPSTSNRLRSSALFDPAMALRDYLERRCLHSGADGLCGNEAARYLQRWVLPTSDPRRTEVDAVVGWGLLWDIARRPGYGVQMSVGYGAPWPSVRDPHAPWPEKPSCRVSA
ncbi:hypothetical protein ABZ154_12565 [Streptomyces sp. NPDC006261]|uniref:hypothetical protein n=1 Tax=Streptomyces sp. NPDC006261 TaxID=3156739 RepID=UPI0033ACAFEC